jgi:hypothetical protein
MREVGTNTQLYSKNVKGRGHSRDFGIDRIALKCSLSKKETESEVFDWIQPAQGRVQRQDLVNTHCKNAGLCKFGKIRPPPLFTQIL